MDAVTATALAAEVLSLASGFVTSAQNGTITQAQIDAMLAILGHNLDSWQAQIDARKLKLI